MCTLEVLNIFSHQESENKIHNGILIRIASVKMTDNKWCGASGITLENCLAVPFNIVHTSIVWSSNTTPR